MDGAVLGVDRDDLGPGVVRARCTTGAPAMIDSLLARASRRPASRAARVTVSPAKPTTPLTATSATVAMAASPSVPATTSIPGGRIRASSAAERRVADGHHLGAEPAGLGGQRVDRALGAEGHHLEPLGARLDHLEGLGADGAGRPDQADRHRPDADRTPVTAAGGWAGPSHHP